MVMMTLGSSSPAINKCVSFKIIISSLSLMCTIKVILPIFYPLDNTRLETTVFG